MRSSNLFLKIPLYLIVFSLTALLIIQCGPPMDCPVELTITSANSSSSSRDAETYLWIVDDATSLDVTVHAKYVVQENTKLYWDNFIKAALVEGPEGAATLKIISDTQTLSGEFDGNLDFYIPSVQAAGSGSFLDDLIGIYALYPYAEGYDSPEDPNRQKEDWTGGHFEFLFLTGNAGQVQVLDADGGTHRYGRSGELLDYPLAYPLVAVAKGSLGKRIYGVPVVFTIKEGSARFTDNSTSRTVYTKDNKTIGRKVVDDVDGDGASETVEDIMYGAAVCPVILEAPGKVVVEATLLNDPLIYTEFTLRCVEAEEEEDGFWNSYTDNLDFFAPSGNGSAYPGDGLWGTYRGTDIDQDGEYKNLRLEIDYVANLGPPSSTDQFSLTSDDWNYIYDQLALIFGQVGILLDPNLTIGSYTEAGSNITQLSSSPSGIEAQMLASTRGNNGQYLSEADRMRLHILVLAASNPTNSLEIGTTVTDLGGTDNYTTDPNGTLNSSCSRSSSSTHSFPWAEDNDYTTLVPLPIDTRGIIIYTRGFPSTSDISVNWQYGNSSNAEIYRNVLVRIIAHEIGHALGLADEADDAHKNQLMYKQILCRVEDEDKGITYQDSYGMNVAMSKSHLDNNMRINMRTLLGRETTAFWW